MIRAGPWKLRRLSHPASQSPTRAWQSARLVPLGEAGHVTVRKTGAGRNRRTHIRLSPHARRAFDGHAAAGTRTP